MRPFPTTTATMGDPSSPPPRSSHTPTATTGGSGSQQRNSNTQFYLPSPATNTDYALSRVTSRHREYDSRRPSASASAFSLSVPASPRQLHRRSRSSLAGLRSALQAYQVPAEGDADGVSHLDLHVHSSQGGGGAGRVLKYDDESERSVRPPSLRSIYGPGIGQEMMDALVEIHRVLYRGREDMRGPGEGDERELRWDEQGKEVKRVVERWFEGDCLYDHPLARVSSRDSLLTHFILLHLLSSGYLPSLAPGALVQHAKSVTSAIRARLLGDSDSEQDVERGATAATSKGKEKVQEGWYGLDTTSAAAGKVATSTSNEGWWKAWDVSADCKEIGAMECYDGYHLALIEHTITLTLLPSFSSRRAQSTPSTPMTSPSLYDLPSATAGIPPASFLTRLAQGLAEEFDYLLHWDLPISTLVEFNEVGKATRVRDVIDVGDAIETFVPFAKRVGWITRRLTGFVTSTLGAVATSFLPSSLSIVSTPPAKPLAIVSSGEWISRQTLLGEKREFGLGLDAPHTVSARPATQRVMSDTSEPNSLGLEGVSMAPDCDAESLAQDQDE